MGKVTSIAWTSTVLPDGTIQPGATFNPWHGCTKVSPACDHCYAERMAARFGTQWGYGQERRYFGEKHWNEPRKWNAKAARDGRKMRVFCASMADVFDNEVEQVHRERLWELIRETPALTWLVLTKRIGNVRDMLPEDWGKGYANVQLGITVVTQEEVNRDVPKLLGVPAKVRFLSIEPMLEAIDLSQWIGGISLIIVGGESGPGSRPMPDAWARAIRTQCLAAGTAFFMKQQSQHDTPHFRDFQQFPPDLQVREFSE